MEATQLWQAALNVFEQHVARKEYETWLKTSSIADFDDGTVVVAMPNSLAVEWVENRSRPLVERTLSEIVGYPLKVRFVVLQSNQRSDMSQMSDSQAQNGYAAANGRGFSTGQQAPFGNGAMGAPRYQPPTRREMSLQAELAMEDSAPLNPKYVFEQFIVGASNRLAHAASMAVAEKPARAYNPLFLYGGVGLGKTHLLHAIGHSVLGAYPGMRVLYVSSEKFTNDMINAIRDNRNEEFRNRYRMIDILMIDDIQFIAGKDSTQEEFFHTFNALQSAGKQIVISSDRPPKAILTLSDRLRSRFEGGLIADVQPPDLETRTAILRAKGDSQEVMIPSEVFDYVARKVQSNIRELEGALNRIIAFATLNHKPPTVEVAALALNDMAANNRRRQITPERVIETVASFYNMDIEDLKAKSRTREIVVPRQIAMYIIREETDTSLTDIGNEFGNRDHTTVMHACEKIEKAKESDNQIRQAVLSVRQMLYGEMVQ